MGNVRPKERGRSFCIESSFLRSVAFAVAVSGALLAPVAAWAVKAYPKPHVRFQPDGTAVMVRRVGDERLCFFESEDGYTLVRDGEGFWAYADPASEGLEALSPSRLRAGRDAVPDGWSRHVRPRIDCAGLKTPMRPENDGSIKRRFLECGFGTRMDRTPSAPGEEPLAVNPTPLTLPVLVILVDFSDAASRHTTGPNTPMTGEPGYEPIPGRPNDASAWQDLFGDPSIPGGLNHYYDEVSYGQFQWDVTVARNGAGSGAVVNDGWYINPQTMAYWGEDKYKMGYCSSDSVNNIKDLIEWAIKAAEPDVDYARYDTDDSGTISDAELMIFVIHAREGQEHYGESCDGVTDPLDHIWSHQWNIDTAVTVDGKSVPRGHTYSINPEFEPALNRGVSPPAVTDKWFGVGVYAHEGFHTLGGPDLYDYDYDATVAGEWDLMDNGSYNGVKSGTNPSHVGTPLKFDIELQDAADSFGWIFTGDVTDLYSAGTHHTGAYRIDALSGSTQDNVMHRAVCPNDSSEWFVLENRAPVGYYEPYLPEFGLLVWHRDVNGFRDDPPYAANVERKGWNTTTADGLNSSTAGAAFSYEDGASEFTSSTDPNNALNNETASGLLDVRCIGAETSSIGYVYGSVSGPHVDYAGSTVLDLSGDGDGYIDNSETVTLTVKALNSSCAGQTATAVTLTLAVAADSDIPASAVTLANPTVFLGDIAAGATAQRSFLVTLACDPAGYADRSITFAYALTGSNISPVSGTFAKATDKDLLFSDDAEAYPNGWAGTTARSVSACTTALGHGDWIWSTDRAHSATHSYHTPEASPDVCHTDPEESWVSPNITVPSGTVLKELRFWHAAAIPCPGYSRARVWISTDGGTTWIRNESFYLDAGDLSWGELAVPLSAYAGATQFRFKFVVYTYTCWSGCTGTEGWYVDDIRILINEKDGCACTNPSAVSVTPDGPLSPCLGVPVTLTATPTGGTAPLSYQWTEDGSPVSGATAFTYSPVFSSGVTRAYTCRVTGYGCAGYTEDTSATSVTWSLCSPPAEVSDDASHHLKAAKDGDLVDLEFEDVGAYHYQLYVSSSPVTTAFQVTDAAVGKKDCLWSSWTDAGELLQVGDVNVEAGLTSTPAVLYFLVTADNGTGSEGSLGTTSEGATRTADSYCDGMP
ncbi:MAG: M6 family metalloprotease domain-containing protein [Acidobacteriota bacterium]